MNNPPKLWQVLAEYLEHYAVPYERTLLTFRVRRHLFRMDIFAAQLEINSEVSFGLEINMAKLDLLLKFPDSYKGLPKDNDFIPTMKTLLTVLHRYDV